MSGTFIIAEAGVNHNGNIELARELVSSAAFSGADAVKFQSFRAEHLVARWAEKASYQRRSTDLNESQFEMLRRLEIDENAHRELFNYGAKNNIEVMSTPFDAESADMLESLGVKCFKIGSGEITNIPFLRHIARKGRPIILSTGMSTMDEVAEAVLAIQEEGNKDLTLLHCVSSYPVPMDQANVRAMDTMRNKFQTKVGYSDHTKGIEACLAAVALGARVIEKHFTIDKNLPGPDHEASLDVNELKLLVESIRSVEAALGDGIKRPMACEVENIQVVRRSLFAAVDIPQGELIQENMIESKRPAVGIPPSELYRVIGNRSVRVIERGEIISWKDLIVDHL